MGKIIKKRIEYGGSSNSAENIKYDATKNVKTAIEEVKSGFATLESNLGGLSLEIITEDAYQALETKDENTLYIRPKVVI